MTDRVDCIVIGAGVVGLAVARELAMCGRETIVLESEQHIGTGTSSRNSEVIHAGIYYVPGSLKARLCVEGKQLLYDYCAARGIAHDNCGKLIVATTADQAGRLRDIVANAQANGVRDLEILDRGTVGAMEPELECVSAILSPSTGIVDSHALMLGLQGDLEAADGMIAFGSPVVGGERSREGVVLQVGGDTASEIAARRVINCAGLSAQQVSSAVAGIETKSIPPLHLAKGNYYSLDKRAPFTRLVYPAPGQHGLGIHFTLDLAGRGRFGPDVEWVDQISYEVDPSRADSFYGAIRKYWPGLPDGVLSPAYSGIRPKLQAPGGNPRDFVIQDASEHGVPGLINLYGIESPGLTASMAIANHVRDLCQQDNS